MSNNGNHLGAHVQDKDTKRIVTNALNAGWEWVGITKGGHLELRWPATDQRVWCGTTTGDRNSWKWFARDIKRICGVDVTVKVKKRRHT